MRFANIFLLESKGQNGPRGQQIKGSLFFFFFPESFYGLKYSCCPFGYLKPGAASLSVCLSVCHWDSVAQSLCDFLLSLQNSFLLTPWTLYQLSSPSLWWAVKWAITKIQSFGCGLKFSKVFDVLTKWVSFHMNIFRNLCAWILVVSVCIKLYIVLTGRRRKRSCSLQQSLLHIIQVFWDSRKKYSLNAGKAERNYITLWLAFNHTLTKNAKYQGFIHDS